MDDVPKGAVYEFLGPRGVWVSSMAAKTNKKTATCAIGSAIAFAAMRDLSSSLTGILAAMSRCPTQIT